MALSKAEKQRRYRERLKTKGKTEEVREKDRLRKQNKRKSLSLTGLKKLRKAERDSKRRHRASLQQKQSPASSSPLQSYITAQSLGKAVKRAANSLPQSPRKRSKVIRTLAKKFSLSAAVEPNTRCTKISDDARNAVIAYFCRDDISWQSPNRKDTAIVRSNGTKEYIQKRFLVMTMKEAYSLFLQDNPNHPIGLSTFCSLRPEYVCLSRDFPHNVCICKYHENVRLLLDCIAKTVSGDIPTHFRDFIDTVVCDQDHEECMFRKCLQCCSKFEDTYCFPEKADVEVEWIQWASVEGRATKMLKCDTLQTCISELQEQLPAFLIHTFIKRKQSAHFEAEKAKANGQHVVLQVDFAENYAIIQQNEIQSGHWNHEQVTIFTGCAHVGKGDVKSYAIVSDELVHGKYAVATFVDHIIKDLKESCPELKTISFFSDGAASQFKQRFLFENLTYFKEDYNINATWNFFATSHGKGTVDGIGGHVKRMVFSSMKTGTFINDAKSFAAEASRRSTAISVMFIPAQEVEDNKTMLDARWTDVKCLPNTLITHTIEVVEKHVVRYANYATSNSYKQFVLSENATQTIPSSSIPSDSDSTSSGISASGPSVSSGSFTSQQQSDDERPTQCGDFVLVEYVGANKVSKSHKFVALVTEVHDTEIYVTHLHKSDKQGKVFVAKDLTDKYGVVAKDQVIKLLPLPSMDNRERYIFSEAISEAN